MAGALSGLDQELVAKARLVLDELGSNVVLHRTTPEAAGIEVSACGVQPDLRLKISDTAGPFDPATIAPADVTSDLTARRVGGLGLHIIQRLSDGFRYAREGDKNVYRPVLCGSEEPVSTEAAGAKRKTQTWT